MSAKRMTLEKLAMMVQTGFTEIYERLASKEDLNNLRKELRLEFKEDLFDMEDRINIRINKLEDNIRQEKLNMA